MTLLRRVNPLLHPILFAAFPLLSLYAHNQSEVELSVLWTPLALCVAVAAALYGLSLLIFKRGTKAGVLASLIVVTFFYYGILHADVSGWGLTGRWFFPVWMALFVLGVIALVRTRRDLGNLTLILTVGAAVLALGPVARIAIYQANNPSIAISDPRLWPTRLEPPVLSSGARPPDIYFLIPDDYARSDVLKQYFRYDNADFIRQLEQRGFVISKESRSPYSDSEMNIAAALNMDYLSGLASILGKNSQDVRPVRRLIEDNRASRLLTLLGYRYYHVDSDEVTFAAGNPDISPVATPDSFMTFWLQQSVLGSVGGRFGFNEAATNERFRKTVRSAFAKLTALPQEPSPKFVFFHTLLPHDPYIFGAEGQALTFPDTSDEGHTSKFGMSYYVKQAQFIETKLLEATDAILAQSKEPPIVVIQADEGFEASEEDWGEETVRDIRVKGLAAFYLPGMEKAPLPQKLNTVNSLRFMFNHYFGTHYPILRNASYPELDLPYEFEEMPVRSPPR
jgi:hypothetical protein